MLYSPHQGVFLYGRESFTLHRSHHSCLTLALAAALLLTGCGQPNNSTTPAGPGGVDPAAPVAGGHAALPLDGQPTALAERPPEGLYAAPPTADTLQQLGQAPLSPDGRFRALLSGGDAWVVRVDAAWIWQVQVPTAQQEQQPPAGQGTQQSQAGPNAQQSPTAQGAQQPPAGQPDAGGGTAANPNPAVPATIAGPLQWTPESTLLFQDSTGYWHEANPDTAIVTTLPAAFLGATGLTPSPDGHLVMYYKGTQLYTAQRDGSKPVLVGNNLVGHWDSAGQLVTTVKAGSQPPQ